MRLPLAELTKRMTQTASCFCNPQAIALETVNEMVRAVHHTTLHDPVPTFEQARYAKTQIAARCVSNDKLKTRAARLAEYLGGRYSGRERAYIMSVPAAGKLVVYYLRGYDASTFADRLRDSQGRVIETKACQGQTERCRTEATRCDGCAYKGQRDY